MARAGEERGSVISESPEQMSGRHNSDDLDVGWQLIGNLMWVAIAEAQKWEVRADHDQTWQHDMSQRIPF